MAEDTSFETSDVALLYCEDPKNDIGGGYKSRSRTLNKSYQPDLPHFANGWMCVSGPDGTGTYKIQQKDLHKCNINCWMLVGENVGDDQWTSAKITVGQYLSLNSFALPNPGPVSFVDKGDGENHITGSDSGWAYPGETIKIGMVWNDFFSEDEMIFHWSVNSGKATITEGVTSSVAHIQFTGTGGEFFQIGAKVQYAEDHNIFATGRLVIMGQTPSDMSEDEDED